MKVFKDLKVGDTIYVNFEKKSIIDIKPDEDFEDYIRIDTNDGVFYTVQNNLSSYLIYDGSDILVCVNKEAVIRHYINELHELQIEFDDENARLEKMLEKARNLE